MTFRSSVLAGAAAILVMSVTPGWAGQSHQYLHQTKAQSRAEARGHDVAPASKISQQRIPTAPVAARPLVGVGPQTNGVQRIRDLAMAPTG